MEEKEVTQAGGNGTCVEQDGKFWVLKTDKPKWRGKQTDTFSITYVEVDKKEYLSRLKSLAKKLASQPGVKIEDVIVDALKEFSLEDLEKVEKTVTEAFSKSPKEAPKVKTRSGHCADIVVGRKVLMRLR